MDEQNLMLVMDTMSQMFETLVKRIEDTERKLDEQCSCKKWVNDIKPGAVILPVNDGPFLTQEEVNSIVEGVLDGDED